mmetsp:Transcript_24583/g.28327  ORF Transcript_24583/g.28327 Transcript_24583/m.28327 type:complete len:83 (+) Transcript_24583:74-322(+)
MSLSFTKMQAFSTNDDLSIIKATSNAFSSLQSIGLKYIAKKTHFDRSNHSYRIKCDSNIYYACNDSEETKEDMLQVSSSNIA